MMGVGTILKFMQFMCFTVKELSSYLQYVADLQYAETPDYDRCRQIFSRALSSIGCKETTALEFVHMTANLSPPKVSLLLAITEC
jgi:hypothetical protein